jgi:predicted site-specific integrase-resolvase
MAYQLLDTDGASDYLGRVPPTETLKQWRSKGKGPRYVKLPNGKVRYRTDDLDRFVEQHTVDPKVA